MPNAKSQMQNAKCQMQMPNAKCGMPKPKPKPMYANAKAKANANANPYGNQIPNIGICMHADLLCVILHVLTIASMAYQ